jgi:hypothetical protein
MMPNPAVAPVPFGHWTLRDKAAQKSKRGQDRISRISKKSALVRRRTIQLFDVQPRRPSRLEP